MQPDTKSNWSDSDLPDVAPEIEPASAVVVPFADRKRQLDAREAHNRRVEEALAGSDGRRKNDPLFDLEQNLALRIKRNGGTPSYDMMCELAAIKAVRILGKKWRNDKACEYVAVGSMAAREALLRFDPTKGELAGFLYATAEGAIRKAASKDSRRGVTGIGTKAIRWGIATKNPAQGLELGPRSKKRAQVSLDQVEAVKALTNERMRAAIDLAVMIGQRRGDLLTLKWENVTDGGISVEQSKGGARLLIEHSADLDAVLGRLKVLKPDIPREYLIRKRNGRPYSPRGFTAIWQRLMAKHVKAAGVRFTFHDLRSVSADGAATPEEARDRLGHASVETTKRHYLRGVTKAKPRSAGCGLW
jgi:integrase